MAAIQVEWLLAGVRDTSGLPLNGGKVYTYEAGTTTDKATHQDASQATPHANPIVLDSNGRKLVFAEGAYKFVVKTSADVTLYTFDDLTYESGQAGIVYAGSSGGSANAQTLSPSPAPTAYATGDSYRFIAGATNTAATTINITSLGAKTIKDIFGDDLIAGIIKQSGVYDIMYNGTNFILLNGAPYSYYNSLPTDFSGSAAITDDGGAAVLTNVSWSYYNYNLSASWVEVDFLVEFDVTVAQASLVQISLPIQCRAAYYSASVLHAAVIEARNAASGNLLPATAILNDTTGGGATGTLFVYTPDGTNWTVTADKQIRASFRYRR